MKYLIAPVLIGRPEEKVKVLLYLQNRVAEQAYCMRSKIPLLHVLPVVKGVAANIGVRKPDKSQKEKYEDGGDKQVALTEAVHPVSPNAANVIVFFPAHLVVSKAEWCLRRV